MEFKHGNVKTFEIKRRTFEGRTDPEKNDCALTSKYMPSYKYWMRVELDDGITHEFCRPGKQDCLDDLEKCKQQAGKLL